jgi:hypothetical protein
MMTLGCRVHGGIFSQSVGLLVAAIVMLAPAVGLAAPTPDATASPHASSAGKSPVVEIFQHTVPLGELTITPGPTPHHDNLCLFAPRRLREIGSEGWTPLFTPPGRVWTQTAWDHGLERIGDLVALEWKGDAHSFIDVFDQPIFSGSPEEVAEGASAGNVLRLRYPSPDASCALERFELNTLGGQLNTPLPWGGARAFRHYDRGRCSAAFSWRQVIDAFAEGLETGIDRRILEGGGRIGDIRIPLWAPLDTLLTPHLVMPFRRDRDFFRYTQGFSFDFDTGEHDGELRMQLHFDGQLFAEAGTLRFRFGRFTIETRVTPGLDDILEGLFELIARHLFLPGLAVLGGGGDSGDLRTQLVERFRSEFEAEINRLLARQTGRVILNPFTDTATPLLPCTPGDKGDAACFADGRDAIALLYPDVAARLEPHHLRCLPGAGPEGGACAVFPTVHRVFQKADGIEAVLVERPSDPLFRLLEAEAPELCERVPPATREDAVTGGYFGHLRYPLRPESDTPTVGEGDMR